MRVLIVVTTLAALMISPAIVHACGKPKPNPPPECGVPTPVPTTPTPAPTTPPVQTIVPTLSAATVPSGGSARAEWCHFEPTTGQWEIRHGAMQTGDRAPIEKGLCVQTVVPPILATPVPAVVMEVPTPEAEVPPAEATPSPPVNEVVPPAEDVVPPVAPPVEEVPPCVVPVQIPDWACADGA